MSKRYQVMQSTARYSKLILATKAKFTRIFRFSLPLPFSPPLCRPPMCRENNNRYDSETRTLKLRVSNRCALAQKIDVHAWTTAGCCHRSSPRDSAGFPHGNFSRFSQTQHRFRLECPKLSAPLQGKTTLLNFSFYFYLSRLPKWNYSISQNKCSVTARNKSQRNILGGLPI